MKNLFELLFITFLTLFSSLSAEMRDAKEEDLKVAYIYNFARYTSWSEDEMDKDFFTICVHQQSELYESVKKLENKKLKNRSIKVITIDNNMEHLLPCEIVVLPQLDSYLLEQFATYATSQNILSISNSSGYAHQGVMINLKAVNNKMTFEINLNQVQRSNLKISSSLLKLATIVQSEE